MASNPLHRPSAGTLDETIIRPNAPKARYGWRWALSCLYLFLLAGLMALVLWSMGAAKPEALLFVNRFDFPELLLILLPLLSGCLLFFRTQVGWVMATIILAAMIVLSTLGLIAQFMPSIEPENYLRGTRVVTSFSSMALACGVFYLLSHPALRAGFRVPQSWIRRCVTLGGLLGTGFGVWLLYLTGLFGRL